jgi:hypothetical protein
MALEVKQVDVWAASIEDRPGGAAGKLAALSKAGVNLEFVVARRSPDKPGTGVLFAALIEGDKAVAAAKAAGFAKAESMHSVHLTGPDSPGLGGKIAGALAAAGINLRGLSAAAIRGTCACYLAFDTAADAAKAVGILKRL